MKNLTKSAIIAGVVALAGCGTVANYQAAMEQFLGQPEAAVYANFGPPQNVYESGGSKFLEYYWQKRQVIPNFAPSGNTYESRVVNNPVTGDATIYTEQTGQANNSPTVIDWECTTRFTIQGGYVVYYQFQGNGCRG